MERIPLLWKYTIMKIHNWEKTQLWKYTIVKVHNCENQILLTCKTVPSFFKKNGNNKKNYEKKSDEMLSCEINKVWKY